MSNINSHLNEQQFEGLKSDTIIQGFYIEGFCQDHAGNVWVKCIPVLEYRSNWNQDTFDYLLRVYIQPNKLKGHWRYKDNR